MAAAQDWFAPFSSTEVVSFLSAISALPFGTSEIDWEMRALRMARDGGRRFTGKELADRHAAICQYFGEPASSLAFYFLRAIYEHGGVVPVTPELVRRLPFLNLGYECLRVPLALELSEQDKPFRHHIRLYTHALEEAG